MWIAFASLAGLCLALVTALARVERRLRRVERETRQLWYVHKPDPDTVGVEQPDHH
jgi:hypothetical protein